jgi:hypothetical protein
VQMGSSLHHGLIGPAACLSIIKICKDLQPSVGRAIDPSCRI